MTVEEWALIASVVFSGLWSGLLAMLTLVLHPMLAAMEGAGFARFLRAFLPTARRAPIDYIAEPNYELMLAWDPGAMPADWEARRRRYFALNWIRAAATWVAFGLFLAAPVRLP
jgi:hypothetical protein